MSKGFDFNSVQYGGPVHDSRVINDHTGRMINDHTGRYRKNSFLRGYDDLIRWGSPDNVRRAFNGSERQLKNEPLVIQSLEYANDEMDIWLINNCVDTSKVSDLDVKLNYIAELYALSYLEIFADTISTTDKPRDLKYKARADAELSSLLNYYIFGGSDACNSANRHTTQFIDFDDPVTCNNNQYQRFNHDCSDCIDTRHW
jgi:hypothetical protein